MKKLIILFAVLLATNSYAQVPQKMSYQAVIRNNANTLVTNQLVKMRMSILEDSVSGNVVYVETHSTTTNSNGLASIEIGNGTAVTGSFSLIDWENGPFFIKTETDPSGGTNYSVVGISQLLSVPYALYADQVNAVAGEKRVIDFYWDGDLNGDNPQTVLTTNFNWKGNRRIVVNGTVHVEFVIPQQAIDAGIFGGSGIIDMGLLYDGQLLSLIHFKELSVNGNASITLPFSSVISNSVAGTTKQFEIAGPRNESHTYSISDPIAGTQIGPFPIDMKVSVILTAIEL